MTTSDQPGADAWQRPKWYSRVTCGGKLDAISDADGKRIRWAAGAIQSELHAQGHLPEGRHDGHYGPLTDAAIRAFQRQYGLVPDGSAGPKTLRHLCWQVVRDYQAFLRIPDMLLFGMLALESGMDPGAQGVDRTKSTDRGLAQISDEAFDYVTDAEAYGNIRLSIHFAAVNMVQHRRPGEPQTYAEMGMWDLAVAAHNSPVAARDWFDSGQPSERIATYVRLVRKYGAQPV